VPTDAVESILVYIYLLLKSVPE